MPQKNSAHLLAKQDNQCGAPRPNWDAARLVRSKEKKMEVDWPRKQNATDIYSKNSHALDPRRKQEEGTTKRDVEKVRGARDEGSRVELGPARSQSWKGTDHDGVPRCQPYVRARTKRTK